MPNVKYMRTTQADGDIKDERESEKPRMQLTGNSWTRR